MSTLNRLARELLETNFPPLWISGEISNFTQASSGHIYFTLKDGQAQARCAMWRGRAQLLTFRPENGMRVEAHALVTLYETRGDYQLNVETLRPAGIGDLFETYQKLKDKLAAEGLFDLARRPLPAFPRAIGVVTSPAAAALRDVLATLRRRAPGLPVVLYPTAVQGMDAPRQLCAALAAAGRRAPRDDIEIILLVRGGGSLEDLWAFNDENLARAISACPVPVISGVGHETDFTIADFAADLRAATPSSAAELASAGYHGAAGNLAASARHLRQALARRLESSAQRLDHAAVRLVHPRERIQRARETATLLEQRLRRGIALQLTMAGHRLAQLGPRLGNERPTTGSERIHLDALRQRLALAVRAQSASRRQRLETLAASLCHLDPQAVLARGYGIVHDATGNILRSAAAVRPGETIDIQLADGRLDATVREARASNPG